MVKTARRQVLPSTMHYVCSGETSQLWAHGWCFTVQEDVNPWDTKRFSTANCAPLGTCENGFCGMELVGDLTVRVGEAGHHGSYYYTTYALQDGGDDRFTHCSMYPCTKEECAVPEQMGLELQFSFFTGAVRVDDFAAVPLLVQEFYLKAAFVGAPLLNGKDNRFGPMHMEWMDDPVGCRVATSLPSPRRSSFGSSHLDEQHSSRFAVL
ncbi:hypothetical protein MHU86_23296 [Fragilaria crotonensis]|nr:hypothetical protein MHU86_23296 [Fragilaria crotonensis]